MIESETIKIFNQVNNLHMIPLNTKIDILVNVFKMFIMRMKLV